MKADEFVDNPVILECSLGGTRKVKTVYRGTKQRRRYILSA